MIADILFLLFSAGVLAGGALVAMGRHPMVGILGLLTAFLSASGLFILMGAEFLGLLLIMVYVGAVAVMFLFVLMTIDVAELMAATAWRKHLTPVLPVGVVVVGSLATLLVLAVRGAPVQLPAAGGPEAENIVQLGRVLFTHYAVPFQMAAMVLLVAMVGAIGLTHRPRKGIRRQHIGLQVGRTKADAMVLTQPAVGQGATPTHWVGQGVEKHVKGEE